MGSYPDTPRAAFFEWCQVHAPIFAANAEDIGLTEVQAGEFTSANTAAHTSVTAQETARTAAKAATETANDRVDTLRTKASDTVRSIRAYAELQPKPLDVYTLAQISPPAPPGPMPAPGQPTNMSVTLTPVSGELTLKWKCSNPPGAAGTSYLVRRRLPGESQWTFIGVTGRKEFVDSTLFAGPDSVQYTVQAQRSDSSGPISEALLVSFGRTPEGGLTAIVAGGGNAYNATASTVDGRVVQKVTPMGNGRQTAGRV